MQIERRLSWMLLLAVHYICRNRMIFRRRSLVHRLQCAIPIKTRYRGDRVPIPIKFRETSLAYCVGAKMSMPSLTIA